MRGEDEKGEEGGGERGERGRGGEMRGEERRRGEEGGEEIHLLMEAKFRHTPTLYFFERNGR